MIDKSYLAALSSLSYQENGMWDYTGTEPTQVRALFPPMLGNNVRYGLSIYATKGPALVPRNITIGALLRHKRALLPKTAYYKYVISASEAGLMLHYDEISLSKRGSETSGQYQDPPYDAKSTARLSKLERSIYVEGSYKTLIGLLPPHFAWRIAQWHRVVEDVRARWVIAKTDRVQQEIWSGTSSAWCNALAGNTLTSYLASGQIAPALWAWTHALPGRSLSVVKDRRTILKVMLHPAVAMVTSRATFHIARLLKRLEASEYAWSLVSWADLDILIAARLIQILNEDPPWFSYLRRQTVGEHDVVSHYLPFLADGELAWVTEDDVTSYGLEDVAPPDNSEQPSITHVCPYVISLEPWAFLPQQPILSSTIALHGPVTVTKVIESVFATLSSTLWVPSARYQLLLLLGRRLDLDDIDHIIVRAYLAWSAILNWAIAPLAKSSGVALIPRRRLSRKNDCVSWLPWSISYDILSFLNSLKPVQK